MDAEKALGRGSAEISSVVGYAGGLKSGPDGKVCYYYSDPRTVYERLGHAEVVKVDIASPDPAEIRKEFKSFAKTYFGQFRKTPLGMQRLVGLVLLNSPNDCSLLLLNSPAFKSAPKPRWTSPFQQFPIIAGPTRRWPGLP